MAKLPDFLFNVKSEINNDKQSKHLLYRRHLSVAVIAVCLNCTVSAKASGNDSDGDGLTDAYEVKIGSESYLSDTDGDGLSDGVEVGDNLEKPHDSDNDGVIDVLDYDDDNDGLPTYLESKKDSDKDGLLDYLDSDSDNDGIADGEEAGFLNQDKNLDGVDDAFDLGKSDAVDDNGDGIDDNVMLPDHDNDGKPDYLDAKYQHKLIRKILVKKTTNKVKKLLISTTETENEEEPVTEIKSAKNNIKIIGAQPLTVTKSITKVDEAGKVEKPMPDNMIINRHTDSDNDGLSNALEKILGTNPLSRDSDGDKVSDAIEIGLDVNSPQDSDRDGIIDALDDDDDNDGILTKLEDLNNDSTAINDDTDNDGVPNYLDANDDGDSKLTKAESFVLDSDGDGILDYLDKDDGIKNESNASNTKKVAKDTDSPSEPEVVVLFDGDAAALVAEDTSVEGDAALESILNSIEDLSLVTKLKGTDKDDSLNPITQAKLNVETPRPKKKPTSAWDLF